MEGDTLFKCDHVAAAADDDDNDIDDGTWKVKLSLLLQIALYVTLPNYWSPPTFCFFTQPFDLVS